MKKYFYSHIIETSEISLSLGEMDLTQNERKHLIELAEQNLHHAILDAVLSELSEDDKQLFIEFLQSDENDKIWKLLKNRVGDIEDKIKKTADELKKELQKDIEESRKK